MKISSSEWFERAKKVMPGGVSSPVRAFGSVGGQPLIASHGDGAFLMDKDGQRYTDLVGSWGPLIHGHNHPKILAAIEKAMKSGVSFGVTSEPEILLCEEIVSAIKSVEMVRLVNSGTEACMSALRLARGATGREIIVKFEGHYHGHADSFLVSAGSGLATAGVLDSSGVSKRTLDTTRVLQFNDCEALKNLFKNEGDQIAGVILEVVSGNMGVVPPTYEFLKTLRQETEKAGSILIFDEVMTGFRLSYHGVESIYGIEPDLICFGKIIGGGLPVGAYGGKKSIMSHVSPLGSVYQAGTLSGNPLGAAAGLASLQIIKDEGPMFYQKLDISARAWRDAVISHATSKGYEVSVSQVGSMVTIFFLKEAPHNFQTAKNADREKFKKFFWALLKRGIYYPQSQFEAAFLGTKHEGAVLENIIEQTQKALDEAFG